MKNLFKKAVSLTIALGVVAAISAPAFAATATYYAEETKVDETTYAAESVTVTGYEAVTGATQYAVAVVPANFTGAEENADSLIYYVNQYDTTTLADIIKGMLLKGALEDGEYEVRIGNNAPGTTEYAAVPFTVKTTSEGVEITLDYGDVNGDGAVDNGDAGLALQKYAKLITAFEDQQEREVPETVGDVNGDGAVDNGDAGLILQKYAKLITGFEDQNENPLTTYTYTYVAPTE